MLFEFLYIFSIHQSFTFITSQFRMHSFKMGKKLNFIFPRIPRFTYSAFKRVKLYMLLQLFASVKSFATIWTMMFVIYLIWMILSIMPNFLMFMQKT